jgi:hypothetical protein
VRKDKARGLLVIGDRRASGRRAAVTGWWSGGGSIAWLFQRENGGGQTPKTARHFRSRGLSQNQSSDYCRNGAMS